MADYIYLLQNRLTASQQTALQSIRDVARAHSLTVFLVGGAVRDLTSGSPVHDLDVVVQGNALKLKKEMELAGAVLSGEIASAQSFFALFPGGVRVEVGSTLSASYPKPGKPVFHAATILEDLRRRDFTANAMALSLNEGSYGLLMDPLNGVADIENRQLRLVSNYGFIEEPVRMIRAVRFSSRLGWTMDEKTQTRYDTGKAEKYIGALSNTHRGYETEEIFHEEDPLRALRKLEEEGWMKHLFPSLTVAKANVGELEKLREVQTQLQMSGIHPDAAAAHFSLMTAKMSAAEVAELKKSFVRPGFVREIEALDSEAREFTTHVVGKGAALPSQAWKLIHATKPEAVLWAAYSSKSAAAQAKLKSFHTEWPKAKQKVPFALMQEMRIVPELAIFNEVSKKIFFELMDGNLATPEEQKAFLEPFSPPAPPPPVRLGRSKAGKKDGKGAKGKKKPIALSDEDEDLDADDLPRLHDDENEEVDELVVGDSELEVDLLPIDTEDASEDDTQPIDPGQPVEPVAVMKPEPSVAVPDAPAQTRKPTRKKPAVTATASEPTPATKTQAPIAEPKEKPRAPVAKGGKASVEKAVAKKAVPVERAAQAKAPKQAVPVAAEVTAKKAVAPPAVAAKTPVKQGKAKPAPASAAKPLAKTPVKAAPTKRR